MEIVSLRDMSFLKIIYAFLLLTVFWSFSTPQNRKVKAVTWQYRCIDSTRSLYDIQDGKGIKRWFGMAVGDLNNDGYPDVLAGKWLYTNPGPKGQQPWLRVVPGDTLDALGVADVDMDGKMDLLSVRCNEQYVLRRVGSGWQRQRLGTLPICNHLISSQGYTTARLFASGPAHWLMTDERGTIHAVPLQPNVPAIQIAQKTGCDKGLAVGELTRDKHPDVVAGLKTTTGWAVALFANPGQPSPHWQEQIIGTCANKPDRFVVADLNGDGRNDVLVSEGRYPGKDPDARLYALMQQPSGQFAADTLLMQYSMNSLSVGDLDGDRDPDFVVGEHKGPFLRLIWAENNGKGRFTFHEIDRGKEHHIGCLLTDIDRDGDLDIVSSGWDRHAYVHLWYNQRN
jgi:hypothetical protein